MPSALSIQQTHGKSYWFDLPVFNFDRAKHFYSEVLGWKFVPLLGLAKVDYWMIQVDDELIGGLRQATSESKALDVPIIYFNVENLAAMLEKLPALGAELIGSQVDLGDERGWYQWIKDCEGNVIGLWSSTL